MLPFLVHLVHLYLSIVSQLPFKNFKKPITLPETYTSAFTSRSSVFLLLYSVDALLPNLPLWSLAAQAVLVEIYRFSLNFSLYLLFRVLDYKLLAWLTVTGIWRLLIQVALNWNWGNGFPVSQVGWCRGMNCTKWHGHGLTDTQMTHPGLSLPLVLPAFKQIVSTYR